ncbi:uncharacterized protein LOC130896052 [Diorhabda carinulata]|uniref:uncharacterized protein LOC130896052 n=1 Tax=Diorhabda carinulata TaxID=1163345 RepID=UPI0025A31134|nr:uncharacterized protein LOC130896052 [Diorhabda carinulata]
MFSWNEKYLPFPPICTYKTVNSNIDFNYLLSLCTECKYYLDNNKHLEAEYLVLSRIVYRMKQKFRTSKDFKTLEKLCKCLRVYLDINLSFHLMRFIELIPTNIEKEMYIPSKNLLDYILIRLLSMKKLLEKISVNCVQAAHLYSFRIKSGQFWKVAFCVYSLVSRIDILTKHSEKEVSRFYEKLKEFSKGYSVNENNK